MELIFLGTRGGIRARSKLHNKHSSLLIKYKAKKIMIDCGEDWLGELEKISPDAILLTHAHYDHANSLKNGTDIPVFAAQDTFDKISNFRIKNKKVVEFENFFYVEDLKVQAFHVEHSSGAPAIGYKIFPPKKIIFYVPDVAFIPNYKKVLEDVDIYIGDGAIVNRNILLRKNDEWHGHAPISLQAQWCKDAGVLDMVVTHCGTEITMGDYKKIDDSICMLVREYGVSIQIAFDGMMLKFKK